MASTASSALSCSNDSIVNECNIKLVEKLFNTAYCDSEGTCQCKEGFSNRGEFRHYHQSACYVGDSLLNTTYRINFVMSLIAAVLGVIRLRQVYSKRPKKLKGRLSTPEKLHIYVILSLVSVCTESAMKLQTGERYLDRHPVLLVSFITLHFGFWGSLLLFLRSWLDILLSRGSLMAKSSNLRETLYRSLNVSYTLVILGILVVLFTNEWRWFSFCLGSGCLSFGAFIVWFGVALIARLKVSCASVSVDNSRSVKGVIFKIKLFIIVVIPITGFVVCINYAMFFVPEVGHMGWFLYEALVVPGGIIVALSEVGMYMHISSPNRTSKKSSGSSFSDMIDSSSGGRKSTKKNRSRLSLAIGGSSARSSATTGTTVRPMSSIHPSSPPTTTSTSSSVLARSGGGGL